MWVKVERVLNVGGGLGEGEPERVSKGAGPGQPLQLERGHLLEGGDRVKVCHTHMAIDKFLTSARLYNCKLCIFV